MSGSYDFEEQERLAELKAWWEDNRWYVIGGILAAIVAFGGYRGWIYWSARQADDAAAMFAPVAARPRPRTRSSGRSGAPLIAKHPRRITPRRPRWCRQERLRRQQPRRGAQAARMGRGHGVEEHRGIARMRLAAVLMEQKKYEEALKVLDGNKDEAFVARSLPTCAETSCSPRDGWTRRARAYKLAAEKAGPRNPVKSIADTKLNALGGAQ